MKEQGPEGEDEHTKWVRRVSFVEGGLGMFLFGLCSSVAWRQVGCVVKDERAA